jgi:hypothetical protein
VSSDAYASRFWAPFNKSGSYQGGGNGRKINKYDKLPICFYRGGGARWLRDEI